MNDSHGTFSSDQPAADPTHCRIEENRNADNRKPWLRQSASRQGCGPSFPYPLPGGGPRRPPPAPGADALARKETVTDFSQGVPLKTVQQVLRYWQTDYDWRKVEARLNAVPNFITEIDGLDIHFIHVRSKHENALPLIVTHGWPGSIIEQLKIIEPLTNPTAHGGSASDAFHLVIPSMPGLRVFRQADHDRLGARTDRARLDHADAAPWLQALCRAGWRLGRCRHRHDRRAGAAGTARHSHQHARRNSRTISTRQLRRRAGAIRSLR